EAGGHHRRRRRRRGKSLRLDPGVVLAVRHPAGHPGGRHADSLRRGAGEVSRGPLTGIRVIELADEQAEYCGLTLAGLGADVIKVEPPGGSPTRRIGPFYQDREDPEGSLFFWQYNRGKRSIVLDLRQPDDRRRFHSLVAGADVLLESTPRGELDGLGLGADALMKELPALI